MSVNKRVLLVINSDLINAGVPNVVMTIVRQLSDRFAFDVVTYHSKEGQYDAEFESYGGKIFRLSLLSYEKHKLMYFFRYVQISRFLKKILKQEKYDIIHCHNGMEAGIFLKHAQSNGIPIRIAHAHGTYFRKGNNKVLLWYHSQCRRLIRKHATVSLACSAQAGQSLFAPNDFINVLNPIDTTLYLDLKKTPHTGCNLLQIGYFCANKNQLFSIKLLKSLLDENSDIKLTFIGFPHDEVYYAEIQKMIDEFSLREYICFLPPDADKSEIFKTTDIVLVPSFTEGLPLVALEAQSAHIVTLLSDHISLDANLGLAIYAEYDHLSEWKNAVKEAYSKRQIYDAINIDTDLIERCRWCRRIGEYYDGQ